MQQEYELEIKRYKEKLKELLPEEEYKAFIKQVADEVWNKITVYML